MLWLLDKATDGIRDYDYEDNAVLIRLYSQINDRSSAVPIAPLTYALQEPSRSRFKVAFTQAVQACLFDGKGLQYLCRGQWSPLDSTNVKTAIEVAGSLATFERRYMMMAALPLKSLTDWATKFDVPLPYRFRLASNAFPGSTSTGTDNPADKTGYAGVLRGAKKNVDANAFWAEVFRLVDEGLQADPRVAGHTVEALTDAMARWAEHKMQKSYTRSTIQRYLEKKWGELQERSVLANE